MMIFLYLVLLVVAVALNIFFLYHVSTIFLIILIIIPIILFAINIYVTLKLKVNFIISKKVIANKDKNKITIKVNNKTFFPVTYSKITLYYKNSLSDKKEKEEILFSIPPKSETIIETEILSKHCGQVYVSISKIINNDLMGITKMFKKIKQTESFLVLPFNYTIENSFNVKSIEDVESDRYSKTKKGSDPSEVFDYHEYSHGDNFKRINWKLSTRLDKLMVKDFSHPISSSVLILFEPIKRTDKADLSNVDAQLDVFFTVSMSFLEMNILFTVNYFNVKYQTIESRIIDSQEALIVTLEDIYNSNILTEPKILNRVSSFIKEQKFSQILYVTNYLSKESVDKLTINSSNQEMCAMFVNSEENIDEEVELILKDKNINLANLNPNTIKSDLQELLL